MQSNSKIIFLNQPKLSEHEVDSKFNQRRMELIPHVENFISNHERFQGKDVSVEFAQKGISSLVCIIKTSDEKLVLKIALSLSYAEGEAMFLKVWEKAGVRVPHIEEEGKINDHFYSLMEYIDAPVLSEIYSSEELLERKIYFEMGHILRAMHKIQTQGFGRVINGKAEYEKFEDWISGLDIQKRIQYIKENKLLDKNEDIIKKVFDVLVDFIGDNINSSYCHNDFGIHSIFATDPITVFDPWPNFNNAYTDLGRSLQYLTSKGISCEQFITGYFNGESYDKKALHAFICLDIFIKFPYIHKTKHYDRIALLKKFLFENEYILN